MKRPHHLSLTLVLAACLAAGPALANATDAEFQAQAGALYNFEPHTLSQEQLAAKSRELDRFWELVKSDPGAYLPRLRRLLADPARSAFFYYDGSKLLLSLSKDPQDLALVARSIPRADLRGIQNSDYLRTVHWLAIRGQDTREAALRILDFPKFTAFIPQHALTLGQDYALVYMLFPMEESRFVGDLVARLPSERDTQSQRSILMGLWYAATPAARDALKAYAAGTTGSDDARKYAAELLARKPPLLRGMSLSTLPALREQRRQVMTRPISDEALMEFDQLTVKILARQ